MTRLGFDLNDNTISQIIKISKLKGIEIEGVFSHFAVSDEADPDNYTKLQFDKLVGFIFQTAGEFLPAVNISLIWCARVLPYMVYMTLLTMIIH